MSRVVHAARADRDLQRILRHIAIDNLSAALDWLDDMLRVFALLANEPRVGEAVKTRRLGAVRRFTHGNYVIYFRPLRDGVRIVRVFHGARDQGRLT
jgi:toxin ParE1/3/4